MPRKRHVRPNKRYLQLAAEAAAGGLTPTLADEMLAYIRWLEIEVLMRRRAATVSARACRDALIRLTAIRVALKEARRLPTAESAIGLIEERFFKSPSKA